MAKCVPEYLVAGEGVFAGQDLVELAVVCGLLRIVVAAEDDCGPAVLVADGDRVIAVFVDGVAGRDQLVDRGGILGDAAGVKNVAVDIQGLPRRQNCFRIAVDLVVDGIRAIIAALDAVIGAVVLDQLRDIFQNAGGIVLAEVGARVAEEHIGNDAGVKRDLRLGLQIVVRIECDGIVDLRMGRGKVAQILVGFCAAADRPDLERFLFCGRFRRSAWVPPQPEPDL